MEEVRKRRGRSEERENERKSIWKEERRKKMKYRWEQRCSSALC